MILLAQTRGQRKVVEAHVVSMFKGLTLRSVSALIPESMNDTEMSTLEGVWQVEAGIILECDEGRRVVRWSMDGGRAALWVGHHLTDEAEFFSPYVKPVLLEGALEVSPSVIVNVESYWADAGSGQKSVWAICFTMERLTLSIALGEIDWQTKALTFIPDSVLMIVDDQISAGYLREH